jgi:cytoskeletal protein CcmA (bactofilin family)
MFSKTKHDNPQPQPQPATGRDTSPASPPPPTGGSDAGSPATAAKTAPGFQQSKPKPSPSLLSSDLTIKGNISSSGDIQVEGTIEGDVRAHLLTVGESATIRGEVIADDVVVNGRVVGRVRGLKVRLTASAKVEGDIVHKTIAIESGAHFEGSVQRQEDPLNESNDRRRGGPAPVRTPEETAAE